MDALPALPSFSPLTHCIPTTRVVGQSCPTAFAQPSPLPGPLIPISPFRPGSRVTSSRRPSLTTD